MRRLTFVRCLGVLTIALAACDGASPSNPTIEPSAGTAASASIEEGTGVSSTRRVSIYVGDQADLSVSDSRRSRLATWNSSDASIARVSAKGLVTGVEVGEATISSNDGTQSLVRVSAKPLITSFSIAPKQGFDLPTNGVRQFSTTAVWSDRAARPVGVTYQASTGTISGSGLFTADSRTGNTTVIAICDCGKADTAIVIVNSAVQLSALRISPKTVTLAPGAAQQFATSANWTTGATDIPPVSYDASPGTVTATGAYRAPSSAGTYYVIVAHVGGTLRDTAIVTVLVPGGDPSTPPPTAPPGTPPPVTPPVTPPPVTPPPPPVVPDAFTPNLPTNAGLRLITDSRFANMIEGRANADGLVYYWSGRNAVDESAPYGSNVFETWYPGNDAGNGIGGANITSSLGNRWRRVYFSIMMWVPTNYVIHSSSEKFFYPIITTNGVQTGSAPVNMLSKDYNPTGPSFGFGMIPSPGHTMEWQDSNVFVQKGKWSIVEMDLQMNTPGNYDASWRVWVDGRLAGDRSGMMFSYTTTTQSYFDAIRFDGTRGGGASSVLTPPGGQVRRYNRLAFYARE